MERENESSGAGEVGSIGCHIETMGTYRPKMRERVERK